MENITKTISSATPEFSASETPPRLQTEIPENFRSIISDFINDLSTTFPEYSYLWMKWGSPDLSEKELKYLFDYIISVLPERFFDILYQDEDIFKVESSVNVLFLPSVDFKLLYNCPNVTEKTQKAIWKYLQLILFTIVNSIKNKSIFGNTSELFDGVNEKDLQEKLEETMKSIGSFFSNLNEKTGESGEAEEAPNSESFNKTFESFEKNIPNPEELHEHLKTIFDGKIGKLAKEMAEEFSQDINGMFGENTGDIRTSQDVLKNLMKDPKKMMDLVKTIGNKLNSKMESGEISQEEIMKEASELIGKMKGRGASGAGGDDFGEMLKTLSKQMGEMGGLANLASMAGLGKNARMDKNALNQMMKKQTLKEKMRERYDKKKQMESITKAMELMNRSKEENNKGSLEQKSDSNFVFKIENQTQEKSYPKSSASSQDIDKIMNDLKLTNDCVVNPSKNKKKNKNKKK